MPEPSLHELHERGRGDARCLPDLRLVDETARPRRVWHPSKVHRHPRALSRLCDCFEGRSKTDRARKGTGWGHSRVTSNSEMPFTPPPSPCYPFPPHLFDWLMNRCKFVSMCRSVPHSSAKVYRKVVTCLMRKPVTKPSSCTFPPSLPTSLPSAVRHGRHQILDSRQVPPRLYQVPHDCLGRIWTKGEA